MCFESNDRKTSTTQFLYDHLRIAEFVGDYCPEENQIDFQLALEVEGGNHKMMIRSGIKSWFVYDLQSRDETVKFGELCIGTGDPSEGYRWWSFDVGLR